MKQAGMRRTALGAAIVFSFALIGPAFGGPFQFNTIALTGTDGEFRPPQGPPFYDLLSSQLNRQGHVLFQNRVGESPDNEPSSRDLWLHNGISLAPVALTGVSLGPLGPNTGSVFGQISFASFDHSDNIAYKALLNSRMSGFWTGL